MQDEVYLKRTPYRNKKILQSAKGEECLLRTMYCNHNPSTVVFAHSNYSVDGKGMGQKADDIFGVYACSECHRALDTGMISKDDSFELFHVGMKKTIRRLLDKGIIK